ncbi:Jasmonoyl--L-amino acid synthetase jar4 [Turnera subulata]|uniref:Jasmonoyl--L-amino acid synthetase jar4 n=1 Tax=Turnera subulata TaxID=218843 RepID=A0A9Q0J7R9_9ROSI|nr:Jasmonoyl--L-amino acid synthetase jar4 [Turnera subulata]
MKSSCAYPSLPSYSPTHYFCSSFKRSARMLEKMEAFNPDKVIEDFEALTKDVGTVQRETLKKILELNGSAEYLQNLGLNGRTDPESFKSCVPIVTHKDLEPYIERMMDGDFSPILTGVPITGLSLSSGTTNGKRKFVPWNDDLMENTLQIFRTSFAFRNRDFPVGEGKSLTFNYSSKPNKTRGGLTAGTATTNLIRNPKLKAAMKYLKSHQSCSPEEVILAPDFNQSLYCHLLCGLIFREEIQVVSSTFAHSIVLAFGTFEQIWEELCCDIRKGILSSRVTAPSVRTAMSKLLRPNPELADLISKKCLGLSNWYGLIPELFPNVKYVYAIMTGSMEPYVKKLRHYAGDVPLMCGDYGASEGWIAANVNPNLPPESATFAVLPDIGYFEFIPANEHICTEPQPVDLADVKIGEEYEILLTTFGGLYRYRLGDVVKVMGFHNSTPELKFIRRKSLLLTINIDKNTERDLQLVVEEAGKLLAEEKLEVVDFSSQTDVSTDPGHYVIFLEISGEASEEVLKECCNCLDRSFADAGYVSSRKVNGIGPLELRVVWKGTFQKVLDHYLGLGAVVNQFKTPRCVGPTNKAVLQILCDNVAKTYFSTAYD